MGREIHLLGTPRIAIDDKVVAPEGKKAWAVLAYLVCSETSVPRGELASLLFADADDPMRTLRWNLTELRRSLRVPEAFKGKLLSDETLQDWKVDVALVKRASWEEAAALPGLGDDLLSGYSYPTCDAFESWLLCERRHLKSTAEAVLRESVRALSAQHRHEDAIRAALRLIQIEPFDETNHVALIRAYNLAGDRAAAAEQAKRFSDLFERELGVSVADATTAAMHVVPERPTASDRNLVTAQIELGEAAVAAGQTQKGIEVLREAAAGAALDRHLRANATLALGSALNHTWGVRREEGRSLLAESLELSRAVGAAGTSAAALLELAWGHYMAAEYDRALVRVEEAWAFTPAEPALQAGLSWIAAKVSVEAGRYEEGTQRLLNAMASAEVADDVRWQVMSLTALGRNDLFRHDLGRARAHLTRAIDLSKKKGWTWATSLPESFLAEVTLLAGDAPTALDHAEHALALAEGIDDPSLACLAGRARGIALAAAVDIGAGIEALDTTLRKALDRLDYVWAVAYTLDALADLTSATADDSAPHRIAQLQSLTSSKGIVELLARSYVYAARMGEASALATAKLLARGIENPQLEAWIEGRDETHGAGAISTAS